MKKTILDYDYLKFIISESISINNRNAQMKVNLKQLFSQYAKYKEHDYNETGIIENEKHPLHYSDADIQNLIYQLQNDFELYDKNSFILLITQNLSQLVSHMALFSNTISDDMIHERNMYLSLLLALRNDKNEDYVYLENSFENQRIQTLKYESLLQLIDLKLNYK